MANQTRGASHPHLGQIKGNFRDWTLCHALPSLLYGFEAHLEIVALHPHRGGPRRVRLSVVARLGEHVAHAVLLLDPGTS